MKTILIPTDFSNNAWKAAGYAANIYRNIPCRFILFHAYYVGGAILEADIPLVISSKSKDINRNLTKITEEFQEFERHDDSIIEAVARYGIPSEAIVREAKNEFADIIVMGTKGASNNESIVIGSSTLGVLEDLPCPVICVPDDNKGTAPEHIMFTTDYHNVDKFENIVEVKEIAEENDSKISIVNIKMDMKVPVSVEDGMEGLLLHNYLKGIPHEYYDHQEDDVEAGILDFAHQKDIDLIVMINRKKTFWEGLLNKSISREVGLHSDIPLLILKDQ